MNLIFGELPVPKQRVVQIEKIFFIEIPQENILLFVFRFSEAVTTKKRESA